MYYRKKPVVVQAVQLNYQPGQFLSREQLDTLPDWMHEAMTKFQGEQGQMYLHANGLYCIVTLEGLMEITPGGYVIRGIQGEIYPCKPDIFEASYEAI